ncbi:hypothetical protein CN448_30075 [Bacillus cereus]|uniref:hypothetical protein n=1 Tax=Bacillus cereus TaxID=1396 RepID=UPI000BF2FCED|nr:hypothetical protein [Bacillus cereus]PEW61507.1 hypothetical protein CN448_30075 [Bacillus cereus]
MSIQTSQDRLTQIEKKEKQLQKKKNELQQKINSEDRKKRTRRLIQTGAIFEKYFECESLEEAEQIAIQFGELVKGKKIIREDYTLLKKREGGE